MNTTKAIGDSTNPLSSAKLNEGMVLIYVNKDEKITWEPEFNLSFGSGATTVSELYVELGYQKIWRY